MTPEMVIVIQFATVVITMLTAGAALFASLRNGRKIQEVHLSVNSRLDEMLASKSRDDYAAGVKHGEDNPRVPSWTELGAK